MAELELLLQKAVEDHASDILLQPGCLWPIKAKGRLVHVNEEKIMPPQSEQLVKEIYELGQRSMAKILEIGDDDFSITVPHLSRFRVSIYKQRGSLAAVIRIIPFWDS